MWSKKHPKTPEKGQERGQTPPTLELPSSKTAAEQILERARQAAAKRAGLEAALSQEVGNLGNILAGEVKTNERGRRA